MDPWLQLLRGVTFTSKLSQVWCQPNSRLKEKTKQTKQNKTNKTKQTNKTILLTWRACLECIEAIHVQFVNNAKIHYTKCLCQHVHMSPYLAWSKFQKKNHSKSSKCKIWMLNFEQKVSTDAEVAQVFLW